MASKMKSLRFWLTVLSYFSPLVFFGLLVAKFNSSHIVSLFLSSQQTWLLVGLSLVPLSLVLFSLCWRFLLLPSSLSFGRLFFVVSQWAMAEQILPFRMSETIKVYYFGIEEKIGKTRTLSAIFGEEVALGGAKILFFICVMAAGSLAGWLYWGMIGYTVVVLCLIVGVRWIIRKINPPEASAGNAPLKKRIRFHLHNWLYQMHAIKNRKYLVSVIFLLLAKIFVEVAVFFSVSRAFGILLTLHQSAAVIAALYLTILFMVTPGHYGVLEGVSMVVLNSFGIPFDEAFTLSVSYHLIISVSFVLVGFSIRLFYPGFFPIRKQIEA